MNLPYPIIIFFARWFPWVVILVTLIFFYSQYKHHKKKLGMELLVVTVSISVAWGLSGLIKILTHMPRPFVEQGIQGSFFVNSFASFPSGHAAVFFALATVVLLYEKSMGIFLYICAALIVIARVVAGVHYSLDISVGALIGIGIGYLAHRYISLLCQGYLLRKKPVK